MAVANDIYSFIKTPSTMVFISKRNSGKTIMAKDVLYSLFKRGAIDAVFVISNTAEISGDFSCINWNCIFRISPTCFCSQRTLWESRL